jgi:hypothetical protein
MSEAAPVLDIFTARHFDAWRLYVDRSSWCPPTLRSHLDDDLEAFPLAGVDLRDLERHMWDSDAPYEQATTPQGGVRLLAKGRSAVALLLWLTGLLETSKQV